MEYLPGVKISDVQELEAKGFSRKVLARNLAKAYLYQFCKFGFFNTDPHPGNLAVK
jgi:predicted unusual protein kinase regulating ubiquinone biosynthesis (AarF/ABC1/UbiB family)